MLSLHSVAERGSASAVLGALVSYGACSYGARALESNCARSHHGDTRQVSTAVFRRARVQRRSSLRRSCARILRLSFGEVGGSATDHVVSGGAVIAVCSFASRRYMTCINRRVPARSCLTALVLTSLMSSYLTALVRGSWRFGYRSRRVRTRRSRDRCGRD